MITRDEAARVAELAKLRMTGEALERARTELASMLEYVAALDAVDTTGIDISSPIAAMPLRGDEPRASLTRAEAFENAPDADREAGLFRVPRVLGS